MGDLGGAGRLARYGRAAPTRLPRQFPVAAETASFLVVAVAAKNFSYQSRHDPRHRTMNPNFKTLVELWEQSTERHGPREAFGTKHNGVWHWITYSQFKQEVDALRSGLAALGIGQGD